MSACCEGPTEWTARLGKAVVNQTLTLSRDRSAVVASDREITALRVVGPGRDANEVAS